MKCFSSVRAALVICIMAFAASYSGLCAEAIFPGLSSDENARISRGEPVVRSLGDWNSLALPATAPGASELKAAILGLKPNYLTEVLAILPASHEAELVGRLDAALVAVGDYTKIPYYSVHWKKTFPLFDSIEILVRTDGVDRGRVDVRLVMDPFDQFPARYSWQREAGGLAFSCENTGPISYHGVRAVQTGAMVWKLVLFRSGDSMIFYSVGAVKAFDMFGAIRDRLEPSFLGRTEAFFMYMFMRASH